MVHGQLVSIKHAGARVRCRLQQLGAAERGEHRKHLPAVSTALVIHARRCERLCITLCNQVAGGTQRVRERGGKGRSADLVQLEEDNVGGDVWTTAKRHRLARARSAAHAARGEWDLNFALCWRGCGSMGCGGSRIGPQPDKASAKAPPPKVPPPSFAVVGSCGGGKN